MVAAGLTEKVGTDRNVSFHFPSCGSIPPPVIMVQQVSFRYNENTPYIYKNLDFGIDLDSRVALVGPNGAGKFSQKFEIDYKPITNTELIIINYNGSRLIL